MRLLGLLLFLTSAQAGSSHTKGPAGLLQPEGAALVDLWRQAHPSQPSSGNRTVRNTTVGSSLVANATAQQSGVPLAAQKGLSKLSEQEGDGDLGNRWKMAGIALGWGLLSAFSLVLGAGLAMFVELDRKTLAMMMAFGGGALVEALSIELFGHLKHEQLDLDIPYVLWIGLIAALVGGLAYYGIDRLLNSQGAFVRSAAHVNAALEELKHLEELVEEACEDAYDLVVHPNGDGQKEPAETSAAENAAPDTPRSTASASAPKKHSSKRSTSRRGSLSRGSTIQSLGWVHTTQAPKHLPSEIRDESSQQSLDQRLSIAAGSSKQEEAANKEQKDEEAAAIKGEEEEEVVLLPGLPGVAESSRRKSSSGSSGSRRKSVAAERRSSLMETHHSIEIEHSKSAAMSIWLGILLDGIAESLVLGLMANEATEAREPGLMYAFVISVFVANFPEALSSAGTMKRVGMTPLTIMMMWGLIFVITGIGAAAGSLLFPPGDDENHTPKHIQAALEGVCGGAMLTAISNTVFPEAFEGGGSAVGLASLAGFVTALAVGGLTGESSEVALLFGLPRA